MEMYSLCQPVQMVALSVAKGDLEREYLGFQAYAAWNKLRGRYTIFAGRGYGHWHISRLGPGRSSLAGQLQNRLGCFRGQKDAQGRLFFGCGLALHLRSILEFLFKVNTYLFI